MRSTSQAAAARHVIVIDETLLARLAWVAVAAAVISAVFISSAYLLAAIGAAVVAAIGVTSYFENETRRDFHVALNDSWISVIDALADNGFSFGEPTWHGVTEGRIAAGSATVVVEQHPHGISRVRVRVGTFSFPDNRRRAALIMERVVKYLDTDRSAARTSTPVA